MSYTWMRHPDLPDTPPCEQPTTAFEAYYFRRGWVQCDPPDPDEPDAPAGAAPAVEPAGGDRAPTPDETPDVPPAAPSTPDTSTEE